MHLTSLFCFKKTHEALHNLEKLLICKKCNKFFRNPRRHEDCGNILCACSAAESDTCPYCSRTYSLTNTSPDWQLNSIIEASKRIKDLIQVKNSDEDKDRGNAKCAVHEEEKTISGNVLEKDVKASKTLKVTSRKAIKEDHSKKVSSDPAANGSGNVRNSKTSSRLSKESNKERRSIPLADQSKKEKVKDISVIKSIMKRNLKGETRLHTACIKSDVKKVEEYLAAGADPCTKDNAGWTPLHEAVSKGNLKIVKLLLEAGAMVNVPGGYNNTPLHDAMLNNHLDIARLLIAFGADPDIKNIEGFTPRSMAQTEEMDSALKERKSSKIISMNERIKVGLKEMVIFGVNLPPKDQEYLNAVAQRFKIKQTASFQSDLSHIVVAAANQKCTPTIDIFCGILKGKWIVDSKWLKSCLNNSKMMDPSAFEVTGTNNFPNGNAPKKSRLNSEKMQPSLFNGFHVYFTGVDKVIYNDMKFTKSQLTSLVTFGDGMVLTREPNPEAIPPRECTVPYHAGNGVFEKCSHLILYQPGRNEPLLKYNMAHVKSLPVSWLLKCIEMFELIEP